MTIGDGHDLKSSRFAGDDVLEACYDNERSLRKGDSGPAVQKVQKALIFLGFPVPGVGANGTFGDETVLAVLSYQEARGLKVDGIVGSETIGSLDEEFHAGPSSEHLVSPSTEPRVSDVPSPLVPQSPVRSPRMPPVSPPEPGVPKVKAPRAPQVERPSVKIPQPPAPPVAEVPILTTQAVPPDQVPRSVSRPATSSITKPLLTIDSQGRKFHSAGTWSGSSSSFEAETGKSVRLEVSNLNVKESSITIKTNTGEAKESVLLPDTLVDFEFSAIEEPFIWRFYVETDSNDSLIEWKLYSNWVPGKSK
jgi:hypothetical protein